MKFVRRFKRPLYPLFVKVDSLPFFVRVKIKTDAYVWSLNLFITAATVKTQSNMRVFVWEERLKVTLWRVLANIVAVEKL